MLRDLASLLPAALATHSAAAIAIGIFVATFVSEDAATLSTSALVQLGKVSPLLGLCSCFAGIWIGDLGIFAAARSVRSSRLPAGVLRWTLNPSKREKAECWISRYGWWTVLVSRFIPGTRVATSLAAGALRMPAGEFALVTGATGLVWVGAAIALWPRLIHGPSVSHIRWSWIPVVGIYVTVLMLQGVFTPKRVVLALNVLRKYKHWEFWPAWLFYVPIVAHIVRLCVEYRSVRAPLFANPGIKTSGLVGESKIEILKPLMEAMPEFVADGYLIDRADMPLRVEQANAILQEHQITYPFVLKPDVGERGSGFRLVREKEQMLRYLEQVRGPVILQRYSPGPFEAGVFYYRRPCEQSGHIFAITDKDFPCVTGDGKGTLEELIRADARASLIAGIYLERFSSEKDWVVPAGKAVRLVEAGAHAQGCIFRDGSHLDSEPLRERIDQISQAVPGFYIGRYDIRFENTDQLRAGKGFTIIELNGVASEATSIYDERNSLLSAYRTLFAQWRLIFEIGVSNQRRIVNRKESWREVLSLWRKARHEAELRPIAD